MKVSQKLTIYKRGIIDNDMSRISIGWDSIVVARLSGPSAEVVLDSNKLYR